MQILLISEDPAVHSQIEGIVRHFEPGWLDLTQVRHCQAVVRLLEQTRFDLLLIDCQLSKADDWRNLHRVQRLFPDVAVVVLVRADSDSGTEALKVGADDIMNLSSLTPALFNHRVQLSVAYKQQANLREEHTQADIFAAAVADIAAMIAGPHALNSVLDAVLMRLADVVPHDASSLLLLEGDVAHVARFQGYTKPDLSLTPHQSISARPDLLRASQSQSMVVTPDVTDEPDWPLPAGANWVRGHLTQPVLLDGEVIGFLTLASKRKNQFARVPPVWMQTFAAQVATALQQASLAHEAASQRQEAATLREITALATATLDLDRLVKRLLTYLQGVVPTDMLSVLLVDGDHVVIVANRGAPDPAAVVGRRARLSAVPLLEDIARLGHPVTVADVTQDARMLRWTLLPLQTSWLGVPLMAHGACIGFLTLDHQQRDAYDADALRLVQTFANQTALAIYNAQLYEEIRRYADELEDRVAERTRQLEDAHAVAVRNEQRYRSLFGATFEAIIVHDKTLVLEVNPAFEALFGYTLDELRGRSVFELIHESSRVDSMARVAEGDQRPYEARAVRRDGSTFEAEIVGRHYVYEGREVRVAAIRDITEHKQAERQRIELALERERTQILSHFITQASHEFKTPLSVIGTSAYVLGRRAATDRERAHVETINQQIAYINRLVENMVTLARLDGQADLDGFARQDMSTVARTALQSLMPTLDARGQSVRLDLCDDAWVWGSPIYLHQAVQALLDNASRHTAVGTSITLQSRLDDTHVLLTVADEGPGIAVELQPRVFERFFRSDTAGTSRGFGLGLPIVQRIVEKHGGHLDLISTPGQGSRFTISLPRHEEYQAD